MIGISGLSQRGLRVGWTEVCPLDNQAHRPSLLRNSQRCGPRCLWTGDRGGKVRGRVGRGARARGSRVDRGLASRGLHPTDVRAGSNTLVRSADV